MYYIPPSEIPAARRRRTRKIAVEVLYVAEDHGGEAVFTISHYTCGRAGRVGEKYGGAVGSCNAGEPSGSFTRRAVWLFRAVFIASVSTARTRARSFAIGRLFDSQWVENSRDDFRKFRSLSR